MTISFRCEHCKKPVTAPDSAGGKRGKCPYCGQSNYIPSPVSEEEVLDLAPIDEQEERRRREEMASLRRAERELLRDTEDRAPVPLEHRPGLSSRELHHFVVNYCLDMYSSQLDRLPTHVFQLRRFKALGLQAVDDLLSGQVQERALEHISPGMLKGFLTQLRSSLSGE